MIKIDDIVDEEQNLDDELEGAQEAISDLVASVGRYSPESDMVEAMLIIKKLKFSAELAVLEARIAIDRKIRQD